MQIIDGASSVLLAPGLPLLPRLCLRPATMSDAEPAATVKAIAWYVFQRLYKAYHQQSRTADGKAQRADHFVSA